MVSVMSLIVPILVAAVIVFIARSVIHRASPLHKGDLKRVPNEDGVLAALRPFNLAPGDYAMPLASSMAGMSAPEFQAKMEAGPVIMMTVRPSGKFTIAPNLIQWFIYSTGERRPAVRQGLVEPGIRLNGLVKAEEFVPMLRQRVDLFAPMSFAPKDADNMKLSFPSKLTDYTASGLPIPIYGPDYSSAVQWARANDGVAYVVTDDSGPALRGAVRMLQSNPALRPELAAKAIEVGARGFSDETAAQTFVNAICQAS